MPIRPELKPFYGVEWKTVTRPRILARAYDRCEWCGVRNGAAVVRIDQWWAPAYSHLLGTVVLRRKGEDCIILRREAHISECRVVDPIVLTVMHLNHVSGDDRDENLKAACQWCHLNYDLQHHHQTRATRKDEARPILSWSNPPGSVLLPSPHS